MVETNPQVVPARALEFVQVGCATCGRLIARPSFGDLMDMEYTAALMRPVRVACMCGKTFSAVFARYNY